ncbi:hypothetical protein PR202_gb18989 [Eleusine coracana subsp. coracana]|uniref:Cystatin domain-containing protein n=1 Tax=Eleusine coracana subsp. coracana TaxID=191504 RepID=A0AAV5F714_ELECO|nr:hypothetical protein PR202_gb18989 [Eleusine coracana subsp. coracana]
MVIYMASTPTAAQLSGGWFTIPDINDPVVQELGKWAVEQHNKEANQWLKFNRVVGGDEQVVQGLKYRLVIKRRTPMATNELSGGVSVSLAGLKLSFVNVSEDNLVGMYLKKKKMRWHEEDRKRRISCPVCATRMLSVSGGFGNVYRVKLAVRTGAEARHTLAGGFNHIAPNAVMLERSRSFYFFSRGRNFFSNGDAT